jgi:hypothetical protein
MPSLPASLLSLGAVLALVACGAPSEPVTPQPMPTGSAAWEPPPEGDLSSTIDVLSGKPTEILLDGKAIGTTPITGFKVTPGPHDVTFIDEGAGNRTMSIVVEAGDSQTVQTDPAPAANDEMRPEASKAPKNK